MQTKSIVFGLWLLVAAFGVAALPANGALPVFDPFDDGDRTNGADLYDMPWYTLTGTQTLTVASDNGIPGIGSGNALFVDVAGTTVRAMVANFPIPFTLRAPGDYVKLNFDFRLTNSPLLNADRPFRFGLFNDFGTPVTGDGQSTTVNNDPGYFLRLSSGTNNQATLNKDKGTGTILGGSDLVTVTDVAAFGGINDNGKHTAQVTVTLAEDTSGGGNPIDILLIEYVQDDGTVNEKTITGDDRSSTTLITTFSEVAFSSSVTGSAVDYVIDNVVIEYLACGDGIVEGAEVCDDGNANDNDACTNDCQNAVCGDGSVYTGFEECDDGNTDNNDACTNSCLNAGCGDGFVYTGFEACDDGNTDNNDACTNGCLNAVCGDGIVYTGVEECDDGNTDNNDACRNGCLNAACGDGIVYTGAEECDDGNSDNSDACTNSCLNAVCGDGIVYTGIEECDGASNAACMNPADPRCQADCTCLPAPVPTVSEWGLALMTLAGLGIGGVMFGRRRHANNP